MCFCARVDLENPYSSIVVMPLAVFRTSFFFFIIVGVTSSDLVSEVGVPGASKFLLFFFLLLFFWYALSSHGILIPMCNLWNAYWNLNLTRFSAQMPLESSSFHA